MVSVFILCFPTPHHCSDMYSLPNPKISVRPPKFVLLPPARKQRETLQGFQQSLISPGFLCSQAVSEQFVGSAAPLCFERVAVHGWREVTGRWHHVSLSNFTGFEPQLPVSMPDTGSCCTYNVAANQNHHEDS